MILPRGKDNLSENVTHLLEGAAILDFNKFPEQPTHLSYSVSAR